MRKCSCHEILWLKYWSDTESRDEIKIAGFFLY
jgi:hypothetical protein